MYMSLFINLYVSLGLHWPELQGTEHSGESCLCQEARRTMRHIIGITIYEVKSVKLHVTGWELNSFIFIIKIYKPRILLNKLVIYSNYKSRPII